MRRIASGSATHPDVSPLLRLASRQTSYLPLYLITLFFVALGGVAFVMAAYLLAHSRRFAAILVLAAFVLESTTRNPFGINIGSLSLYLADWLFSLLLAAVAIRFLTGRITFTKPRVYLAVLMALFALSTGRGVIANGFQLAGVEARPIFYFLSCLLYFGTFDLSRETFEKLMDLVVGTAILLCAIVAWRVATAGLGSSTGAYVNGIYVDGRPLPASAALLISQAMLMVLFAPRMVPFFGKWPLISAIFFLTVVVLQHRTVWAVVLATLVVGVISRTGGRRRLVAMTLGVLFVAPPTGVLLLKGNLSPVRQNVGASVISAFEEEGTFNWRLEGWRSLLRDPATSSPMSLAIGRSFGSGYDRRVNGVLVTYSPHNFYVNTLLRLGIPGLLLILLLYARIFASRWIGDPKDRGPLGLVRLLALTQLVYFVSYAPFYDQGLVTGSIIGLLATGGLTSNTATEDAGDYAKVPA